MRITFVLPPIGLAGGVRVTAIYAERLQARGHQVQVVHPPNPQPPLLQQVKGLLRGKGWMTRPPVSPNHYEGKAIDRYCLERYRPVTAADVPDADVVIATWWETAEWVAEFPPSKGAKVYFIQHDETVFEVTPDRVRDTWRLAMQKVVIAKWLEDLIQPLNPKGTVSLVPNSVDLQQFYASPREKQPIPTVGMLYAGTHWKGIDIMIEAYSIAARRIPNLRLIAFGSQTRDSGPPLPETAEYFYCPPQTKIKDLYAQCDAWLFGSRCEGFGLPILEAMACRTPVIGTPTGAAPELLSQGAGILVPPEDPEAMAQAIEQICHLSDDAWQAMSKLAYERATSYTWDDATELFEAVLHQAVANQKQLVER